MERDLGEMERWEQNTGVGFLEKIGLKSGQVVLDFGARKGHYTIPAAIVVGEKGIVYALDKDPDVLKELERKAGILGLVNITTIETNGEVRFNKESRSLDVVLLYDVLHYLEGNVRKILYQELHRMLKPDGLLSVYPKHVKEDHPKDEFEKLHAKDVMKEIVKTGFWFEREYCGIISHDDSLNPGCILNFRRTVGRKIVGRNGDEKVR